MMQELFHILYQYSIRNCPENISRQKSWLSWTTVGGCRYIVYPPAQSSHDTFITVRTSAILQHHGSRCRHQQPPPSSPRLSTWVLHLVTRTALSSVTLLTIVCRKNCISKHGGRCFLVSSNSKSEVEKADST